jgi:hypothetical protein
LIGPYGVNKEGSEDMYAKGANLMHSIRHSINNDEQFRQILRGLNAFFYHQTVTTSQVEDYISRQAGFEYSKVFDQYLRNTQIPELEYYVDSLAPSVSCRWTNCIAGFNLPIVLTTSGTKVIPTPAWQTFALAKNEVEDWNNPAIEKLYYIKAIRLTAKP